MNKPHNKILLYAFISFLLLVSACGVNDPETLDYHNKILFTSHRSGKDQLYMMNPDGTDIVQLTNNEYWHNNGIWSPDAQKIVCNTEENWTTAGIHMVVMNSDGSNRKLLDYGNLMSWYPDGSQIIYSGSFHYYKLFSVNSNGENARLISENHPGYITFSPDGSKIAHCEKPDSVFKIAISDYPSFNNTTYIGPDEPAEPCWSPTGSEIVISNMKINTNTGESSFYDIFIVNIKNNTTKRVTSHQTGGHYYDPCWSPDGEKIIFINHAPDNKRYIYMVNSDGTKLHKIIDDNSVTSCDWSR